MAIIKEIVQQTHNRFLNMFELKVRRKKSATSYLTPMAANIIPNLPLPPPMLACRTICAASLSCGRPLPEKIGSFCPRMRVVSVSMAEMPVLM